MTNYHANRPTKIIAIEEHFTTPLYHQRVPATEYRKFFLSSRSEQLGHDILAQLDDLADDRLQRMDEAGIDVQVLSFTQPGAQGFPAEIAIPLASDANDRLYEAIDKHPDRFAGFGAIPTADPDAAVDEFERCICTGSACVTSAASAHSAANAITLIDLTSNSSSPIEKRR